MFQLLSESLYDQAGLCFGIFPQAMQAMMGLLGCALYRYAMSNFCSTLHFFKQLK